MKVLLACVLGVIAGTCVAGEPAGRTMTTREMNAAADWLEGLQCYDLAVTQTATFSGVSLPTEIEHHVLGDRYSHSRLRCAFMDIEALCDGDSVWTIIHPMKTYSVEPWRGMSAPRGGMFAAASEVFPPFPPDFAADLLAPPVPPGKEDTLYLLVGDETVQVGDQAVACEVWTCELDSAVAYKCWVDATRRCVVRTESDVRDPKLGKASFTLTLTRLETDAALTPASFTFSPPAGYRRVAATDKLFVKESLEGQTPPDVSLVGLSGEPASTRDWRGKIVVLDYWGVHCPPCLKELKHLQALRTEFGDDVAFIAVTDDSRRKVERLVQQQEITLPICLDPRAELKEGYRISNIPAVFVIDAAGKVRDHFVGLQSPETLREAILKAGAKPLAPVAD